MIRAEWTNADALNSDTVTVVRCKECVNYSSRYSGWHCYLDGRQTQENDFCSWGERRENGLDSDSTLGNP